MSTAWNAIWTDPVLTRHSSYLQRLELYSTWRREADWSPDASFYIDPSSGSDANPGTSEVEPWLTFAKAQTDIAAYYVANPTHKVALYIKTGTICREVPAANEGILGNKCLQYHHDRTFQIRTYGSSTKPPILTVFTSLGSLSWTNVSGNIYTATGVDAVVGANGVSWIRNADDELDAVAWRYYDTDGEVDGESEPSFTYSVASGGTLRLNTGSLGAPGTLSLEANENDRQYEAFVFSGDLSGVWCPDVPVEMHGYGCDRSEPHSDQKYAVKLSQIDGDLGVCVGFRAIYGASHIVGLNCAHAYPAPGATSQAGGQAYVADGYMGACLSGTIGGGGSVSLWNAYAANGLHAAFAHNVTFGAGRLREDGSGRAGSCVYGHTAGAVADAYAVTGITIANHESAPTDYGDWANLVSGDPDASYSVVELGRQQCDTMKMDCPQTAGNNYLGCEWTDVLGAGTSNVFRFQNITPRARYINCAITLDYDARTGGVIGLVNSATYESFTWDFVNCFIEVDSNVTCRLDWSGGAAGHAGGGAGRNTIYQSVGSSAAATGMTSANLANCGDRSFNASSFTNAVDATTLTADIANGSKSIEGDEVWSRGTAIAAPDFDFDMNLRRGPTALGPWQANGLEGASTRIRGLVDDIEAATAGTVVGATAVPGEAKRLYFELPVGISDEAFERQHPTAQLEMIGVATYGVLPTE